MKAFFHLLFFFLSLPAANAQLPFRDDKAPFVSFFNIEILPTRIMGNTYITDLEVHGSCQFNFDSSMAVLSSLPNLKTLSLKGCGMQTLPASIKQLQNLEVLLVSYNNISHFPPEIGELKKLKQLDLKEQFNFSLGTSPTLSYLKGCESLEELDLSAIGLQKMPRFVQYLKKLAELNIHDNSVRTIPPFVYRTKSLQNVRIAGADQTDIIHTKAKLPFSNRLGQAYYHYEPYSRDMYFYKKADITDSMFLHFYSYSYTKENMPKTFENVEAIVLRTQPNLLFLEKVKKCSNVKRVIIVHPKRGTYVDVLEAVPNKDKVEAIHLTGARLTRIPPIIYQFKNLRELVFRENPLQEIDERIATLEKLTYIGFDQYYCEQVRLPTNIQVSSHSQGFTIKRKE